MDEIKFARFEGHVFAFRMPPQVIFRRLEGDKFVDIKTSEPWHFMDVLYKGVPVPASEVPAAALASLPT